MTYMIKLTRGDNMNETLNVIFNRVSLRKFSDEAITTEQENLIVKSALRAPTAGNLMFYSMILVKNKETLKKLSTSCDNQPFIATAKLAIVFLVDYQRLYDYFELSNVSGYCIKNNMPYEYPALSELLLGAEDTMVAAQNTVIAAESLNIGSCYIGDIIENYEFHRDLFNLENLTFPISMLVYGHYPKTVNRKIRERFKKEYIVFNEKYKKLNRDQLIDMFSERQKKFNIDNTMNAENVGQLIYSKKVGSEFSLEMRRSVNKAFHAWKKTQNL